MRRSTRLAAVSLVTALAMLTAGCSNSTSGSGAPAPSGSRTAGSNPQAPGATTKDPCPSTYAQPDPNRPRITLTFDVSADLGTINGTEQVRFIPDMPVRELVFRLTANGPTAFPQGNSVTINQASADPAGDPYRFEQAGASSGSQGGVLVIPLGREVPAGQQVTANISYTLTLSTSGFERFGRSGKLAWFGSGQPLFAWERGVGWHREAMAKWVGESATSEAADIDLTVTAPGFATVLTSGVQDPPADAGNGRRRWHAVAPTARDVSVSVGELHTASAEAGGTKITVGAAAGLETTQTLKIVARAVTELAARFGPFPFPALNVTLLPADGGGIEYPGSILLFGSSPLVDTHETAHQWFYAMVGDSQSRDPWLDEAFASYAEQLVNSAGEGGDPGMGDVGLGINDFPDASTYYRTIYNKGSSALHRARDAVGAVKFDAAIRCYVNANAWRIARPQDVSTALATLPAALQVLRKAGAVT
jgi:predicted small secreted protein